jgi:hypothetical protein
MIGKLLFFSALTGMVESSPVAQSGAPAVQAPNIRVEKPKNFYIEPDLDIKKPYTEDAKFTFVRYGYVLLLPHWRFRKLWKLDTDKSSIDHGKFLQWACSIT